MTPTNVTIVTAFFDLGRERWDVFTRSTQTYLDYFAGLAALANPMVVFTAPDLAPEIARIRAAHGHADRTTVIEVENFTLGHEPLLEAMREVMDRPEFRAFVSQPESPEYWNYHYVLLNLCKSLFVGHAVDRGLVETPLAAWVDFGYVREPATLPPGPAWSVDLDPARIHAFAIAEPDPRRPVFDIVRTGDVSLIGSVLVGGPEAWRRLVPLAFEMMWTLLGCGLVDDDQTILQMAWREEPDLFEIHPIAAWFGVLREHDRDADPAGARPAPGLAAAPAGGWASGSYFDLLAKLHGALRPEAYLEIGVETGRSLALATCASAGVDPFPRLAVDVTANKPWAKLYEMPSDAFFAAHDREEVFPGLRLDLAFVDGLHLCEQVLRDIMHVERWSRPSTVMLVHDVIPASLEAAGRKFNPDDWEGDVWRVIPALRRWRPDLELAVLHPAEAPWTGMLVVTGLDPASTVLFDRHEDIVREIMSDPRPYDEQFRRFLAEVEYTPAAALDGIVRRAIALRD